MGVSDLMGAQEARVVLGDERFDEYVPLLAGKRVALLSNHTGVVGNETSGKGTTGVDTRFGTDATGADVIYGQHVLDALIERGVNVAAIFSPEHGFRGTEDAGTTVGDSVDEATGVPILSLYAHENTHAPAAEDMDAFDTLVVDMQDVGLRYYTYHLSMYHLMDACATGGKAVVILDRPNPNGFYVDGPVLRKGFESSVGELPLPVVHGMTLGELAGMINGEGWLKAGKDACDLTLIPCERYTHQTKASLVRRPSPNLRDMRAVYLYASTCFFENTHVSAGRGTDFPFEVWGSPFLKGVDGLDFSFTPRSMDGAADPPYEGRACFGQDLRKPPIESIWEAGVDPSHLVRAYGAWKQAGGGGGFWGEPDAAGLCWIDKLSGSSELRSMVEAGRTAGQIKAAWHDDVELFKERRRPYLLYDDAPRKGRAKAT